MKTISIGNQSFSDIREKDCFYIDKTDFIREWWEARDSVTLIARPRRFGKTLNMDMLNCFFSTEYAGRANLFKGLSIWEETDENGEYAYRELQGSYPLIFVSFASIKENVFEIAYHRICNILMQTYKRFRFLLEEDFLTEQEKKQFLSIDREMPADIAADSLGTLCEYLSRYYGKKVILLMDEYDTPMQEAYVNGYWDEMILFFRSMFNAAFKTNPYLERAIMTGCTRISKESMFSGLNNLRVVTTTSKIYETSFGFTEEEVFAALDSFGMGEQKEKTKEWYDGFTFGMHTDIYNPWSIINLLNEKEFGTYWVNTSSNGLINVVIQQGSANVKQTMEDLLAGKSLITDIDEQIIFDQLEYTDTAIWSLMLAGGYLKVLHSVFLPEGGYRYELSLTNMEIRFMLRKMIRDWFRHPAARYNDFIKALLLGDIDAMNEFMNDIALQSFSSFDAAKNASEKDDPERFYHGFVLGLMVDLSDKYHVISNRESGFGRYDVMLKPIDKNNDAIIIEFKVHKPKRESSLEETVQAALEQIQDKQYDAELVAEGIAKEQIRHYGFAFRGKEVLIG